MSVFGKIKRWFHKNKKYAIIGGAIIITIVGAGVGYVLYNNDKMTFPEWLKTATREELEEVYEKMRLEFCKTGDRPWGMNQISQELGERGATEWFAKHPPNTDPHFRWTDANRWDKD